MKVAELFDTTERLTWAADYQAIIEAMGEVLIQVDDSDYQGDTRVLLKGDRGYGFLIFGWGSCTGCDALQGCSSWDEVQDLADDLESDVKWFDSLDALKAWWTMKDHALEWYGSQKETKDFEQKLMAYSEQSE